MAQAIMREIWKTSDGKEFATQAEAIKHEEIGDICNFLANHPDLYFSREDYSGADEIAEAMCKAYVMTPRVSP